MPRSRRYYHLLPAGELPGTLLRSPEEAQAAFRQAREDAVRAHGQGGAGRPRRLCGAEEGVREVRGSLGGQGPARRLTPADLAPAPGHQRRRMTQFGARVMLAQHGISPAPQLGQPR